MIDIVFGWRTAVLAVAGTVIIPLAIALWFSSRNRSAARPLALCLIVMVEVFTPWMIGFAGFYDQWPWLTLTPFSNALFIPPLLYRHVEELVSGCRSRRGLLGLLPGILQFSCQTCCFLLPLQTKLRWAETSLRASDAIVAAR